MKSEEQGRWGRTTSRQRRTFAGGKCSRMETQPRGLLTHHHCAGATVPRPCKGRITSTRASPLYSNKQWVHGPSLYPPFARAGDQPQGWWWVRRRSTRRRRPSRPSVGPYVQNQMRQHLVSTTMNDQRQTRSPQSTSNNCKNDKNTNIHKFLTLFSSFIHYHNFIHLA